MTKPTITPETDDASPDVVLRAIMQCAEVWEPEARIIGNIRAGDISRAIRAALAVAPKAFASSAQGAAPAVLPMEPSEEALHIKNLRAAAKNLIGVIRHKQWERLDSKADALEFAVKYSLEQAALDSRPAPADEWRPIDSAPSAKHVLVHYRNVQGKSRIVKAVRYEQFQNEAHEEDFSEYDEENDAYFTPAGWYETIDNWEDFGFIAINEGEPDAWRPLPAAPSQETSK